VVACRRERERWRDLCVVFFFYLFFSFFVVGASFFLSVSLRTRLYAIRGTKTSGIPNQRTSSGTVAKRSEQASSDQLGLVTCSGKRVFSGKSRMTRGSSTEHPDETGETGGIAAIIEWSKKPASRAVAGSAECFTGVENLGRGHDGNCAIADGEEGGL
jgi:hypothetical protein